MKKINLFIACSTKSDVLSEQKSEIVNLCKKLNSEYAKNYQDVSINAVGYDDLERRLRVFKKYIQKNAHIVVFLVDDTLGGFLENELEGAVRQGKRFRRPELLVYLSENIDKSSESKVKKILEKDGLLFDPLKDTEKLKDSIEKRIRGYVNSYESKRKELLWTKMRFWGLSVLPFVLLLSIWLFFKYKTAEQKRLLIAGGGSAKNLIEEEFLNKGNHALKKKLGDNTYWIYSPIPTGSAYRLLTEETVMDIQDSNYKKRGYYTVILSAGKATDSSFLRDDVKSFRRIGVVIGIQVGMDSLYVYSNKSELVDSNYVMAYLKPSVSAKRNIQSKTAIVPNSVIVYTTNVTSGTLRAYESIRQDTIRTHHIFYSTTTIKDSSWLALGSKYYYPKNVGVNSYCLDTMPKPVYIYFMKYRSIEQGEVKYVLPKATKKFLNGIHIPDIVIDSVNNFVPTSDTIILFDHFRTDSTWIINSQPHK